MLHGWLLLLLSLPPRPSSLRVRAWRRLRGLGAVPLRSSAYLLPDSPDRYEQFQWLAQEIQRDGGEATLLRVDRIENMQQPDVVRLFQEARNQDYAALAERYRKLLKGRRPRLAEELARLARETGPDRRDRLLRSARPSGSRARPRGRRGAHRPGARAADGRGAGPGPRHAQGAPLGHASAPPRGPHRLGVAHQALRGSGGRVRLRAARPDSAGRDPLRHGGRGLRASGRGLHLRDAPAPRRPPRPQARPSWPRSSTRPTSRTRNSRARKHAESTSCCARC